jgi:hypothetical protein
MSFVALDVFASHAWFKRFKSFKQFKSLTLTVPSHDPTGALEWNLSQGGLPLAQDFRFFRGDKHRLTAQEIARIR